MPIIIGEVGGSWLDLADTPRTYLGRAGSSPEVGVGETGLVFARKANETGDPTIIFRVANGVNDEDAVNVSQLQALMAGLEYHGVWTPNPTSFPDETLIPPVPVGWYWLCDADGLDKGGRAWQTGDFAIYNGGDATLNAGWDQVAVRPAASLPPIVAGDEGMALVVNAGGVAEWGAPIDNVGQIINGGNF